MSFERTPMKKGDIESRLRSHANTPQANSDIDSDGLSGPEMSPSAQTPTQRGERAEEKERTDPRERALQHELATVRKINQVIEGVLQSFERADHNVDTVSQTVNSSSALLDSWTRILSQTEMNQRLLLNPSWQGATADAIAIHEEELRHEEEERKRIETEKEEEEARNRERERRDREEAGKKKKGIVRGSMRGRTRGVLGRGKPSSSVTGRRAVSGIRPPGSTAFSGIGRRTTSGTTRTRGPS